MKSIPSSEIIYLLDIIGVIACSIAGTIIAKRQSGDILGAIFIAFVASIGGGTIRDTLLNKYPIFWMTQPSYLIIIMITSILTQIFFFQVEKLDKPLRLFDALGAATYTTIGIEIALAQQTSPFVAILMGITTATAGGMMRDIICNKMPLLLQREIYITACLIGAVTYFILLSIGITNPIRQFIVIGIIFGIRMLAIYRNWQLPNITIR